MLFSFRKIKFKKIIQLLFLKSYEFKTGFTIGNAKQTQ